MWMMVFAVLAVMANTQGSQQPCMTKATGATVMLPLNHQNFQLDDELTWKHNSTSILKRKKQKFRIGLESSMMPDGSLKLTDLQLQDSGSYDAEVFTSDGVLVKQSSVSLCVREKVSQPTVNYSCGKQLILTCHLEKRPGNVTFEWTHNSDMVKGEHRETLTVDQKLVSSNAFSCIARNEVSQERSTDINVMCPSPTNSTLTQQSITSAPSGHDLPTPWLKPLLLLTVFSFLLMTYF